PADRVHAHLGGRRHLPGGSGEGDKAPSMTLGRGCVADAAASAGPQRGLHNRPSVHTAAHPANTAASSMTRTASAGPIARFHAPPPASHRSTHHHPAYTGPAAAGAHHTASHGSSVVSASIGNAIAQVMYTAARTRRGNWSTSRAQRSSSISVPHSGQMRNPSRRVWPTSYPHLGQSNRHRSYHVPMGPALRPPLTSGSIPAATGTHTRETACPTRSHPSAPSSGAT